MAMRASKCPLAHVGGFKLAVGVVVFLSALAHEEALAKPAKCGDAGFGLGHVPLRVPPCFIANKPTDRAALEVGLVVRPQHPERHAVVEVDGGKPPFVAVGWVEGFHRLAFVKELLEPAFTLVLGIVIGLIEPQRWPRMVGDDVGKAEFPNAGFAALNGSDDAHDSNFWIHQRLHRLTHPW